MRQPALVHRIPQRASNSRGHRGSSRRTAVALVALALPLAACGATAQSAQGESTPQAPTTVTVTDARGQVEVPSSPQTFVVADFGALDTLDYLGVEPTALPKRGLPEHLKKYADEKYTDLGTLREIDLEKVAASEPALIVLGGRSAPQYDEAKQIAPVIDVTAKKGADAVTTLKSTATTLATVYGKQAQADERLAQIDTQIADVKAKAADSGTALVLMVTGSKLSAYGPGSRFGFVHDVLGLKPAAPNLAQDSHGQVVSFEFVKQTNPDHLFVIDRDAATGQGGQAAKVVLDNPLIASTTASKNDNITYLDSQSWYLVGTGLTTLPAMVDEVESALTS
ncbi:iron complex transport system substrate-binding protein [Kineosphaera limosa]|uniref:Putative iron-siderophore ABC transporter substrate-binding protein n=1 Tax=Kineosphaera limosa NBRC 100340 TaxID=1184609 RepID=K6WLP6_9MICO|nr:siderophore ABC transporter substrate-binding protein [Kineosphaera limosa]NYD98943.1 iron complex transport system substrate-binding protein [Kineosphaera limosa]GAB94731.1 putative iron-siderophore ABC transporter substrate-binding protein [Kineosphaera limosa NBRC 100340]